MPLEHGCVQVYTGNGKGKTTAALGLALRAVGRGLKVCVFQFIKGGGRYGEHIAAEKLAPLLTIIQTGRPGWVNTKDITEDRQVAQEALVRAEELLTSAEFDLFICDEINGAVGFGLIDSDARRIGRRLRRGLQREGADHQNSGHQQNRAAPGSQKQYDSPAVRNSELRRFNSTSWPAKER